VSRTRRFRLERLERRAMLSVNGDFNGDGYDDLAIGVPEEDIGGVVDTGAVNIIFGGRAGLTSINNQFWHQDRPGVNGIAAVNDHFGSALAVGDFNGDGFSDLAIGVGGKTVSGFVFAGAVNILYGSATGLTASDDQQWTQDSSGINDSAEAADFFGVALAAGDFNGDGRDDLAIGAPGDSEEDVDSAGMVNVLYGSATGLTNVNDQHWHQNSSGINDTAELGDSFGFKLAAGDFNGDGRDDLAVGVPNEGVDGQGQAGMVNVIYGSDTGLTNSDDQIWHQNVSGINDIVAANEHFGIALAVGDFDNDGRDDLAIGVPDETVVGDPEAGMVNVIYGSASGLTASGDQDWTQDSLPGIVEMSEIDDHWGTSLAAGDFNGDGRDDLVIGVPDEDIDGVDNVGAVNVIFGSATGLNVANYKFWHQGTSNIPAVPEPDDNYGDALATGDYDGNGRADLVIGAPFEGVGADEDAGAVIVFYNYGQLDPANPSWDQSRLSSDDDPELDDHFGGTLA
jgi:hypothetical protein